MKAIAESASSFGSLSAEYDLFYDHCDGCMQCARKEKLCTEGTRLLEHAVAVSRRDWRLEPEAAARTPEHGGR